MDALEVAKHVGHGFTVTTHGGSMVLRCEPCNVVLGACCPCGDPDDCMYLALGYYYCAGCGDHHRLPVSTDAGTRCPVDVMSDRWAREDALAQVRDAGWLVTDSIPFDVGQALVDMGLLVRRMNPNGRRQSGYVVTHAGCHALETGSLLHGGEHG